MSKINCLEPFEKEHGIFQTSSVGFDSMFFVFGSIHAGAGHHLSNIRGLEKSPGDHSNSLKGSWFLSNKVFIVHIVVFGWCE